VARLGTEAEAVAAALALLDRLPQTLQLSADFLELARSGSFCVGMRPRTFRDRKIQKPNGKTNGSRLVRRS